MMGPNRLSLRQLAGAFPAARWVRAFNTLQARVLADGTPSEHGLDRRGGCTDSNPEQPSAR
jgi:predicted dinucleotide-binding enzyme